jgi:hypothetical protein
MHNRKITRFIFPLCVMIGLNLTTFCLSCTENMRCSPPGGTKIKPTPQLCQCRQIPWEEKPLLKS